VLSSDIVACPLGLILLISIGSSHSHARRTHVLPHARQHATPYCHVRGSAAWLASRASPLDSAELVVDSKRAKICYSRPSARGRSVYDSLAPFGKAWRTGANEPTILELTARARVADVELPSGRYVIMTVPGPRDWIILFYTFEASDDPARIFQSLVETGRGRTRADSLPSPVETFRIRPVDDATGRAFVLEWGHVRTRLPVVFVL